MRVETEQQVPKYLSLKDSSFLSLGSPFCKCIYLFLHERNQQAKVSDFPTNLLNQHLKRTSLAFLYTSRKHGLKMKHIGEEKINPTPG
jgi:hypothetical protein